MDCFYYCVSFLFVLVPLCLKNGISDITGYMSRTTFSNLPEWLISQYNPPRSVVSRSLIGLMFNVLAIKKKHIFLEFPFS